MDDCSAKQDRHHQAPLATTSEEEQILGVGPEAGAENQLDGVACCGLGHNHEEGSHYLGHNLGWGDQNFGHDYESVVPSLDHEY